MRLKAILYCLKYAILPFWVYENECHYECSYLEHFWINIRYAWRWTTFSEDESDIEFEKTENNNY